MGRYWGPTKCPDEPQLQDSFFLTQDLGSHCVTQAGLTLMVFLPQSPEWQRYRCAIPRSLWNNLSLLKVKHLIYSIDRTQLLMPFLFPNQSEERCCLSVPLNESHSYHQRTDTSSPRSHQLPLNKEWVSKATLHFLPHACGSRCELELGCSFHSAFTPQWWILAL